MRTVIRLTNRQTIVLPEKFQADDVRYPDELVRHFFSEFTNEGDVVVDPFSGFGTTLRVAEEMNREGYGIEFDPARCEYAQSLLKKPDRLRVGDSTKYSTLGFPTCALSMTSPPYMGKTHTENPFTAYSTIGGGYTQYLKDLKSIYRQIAEGTKPGGHAVIEVSNLKHEDGTITTLAWDIATVVSEVMHFLGEVIVDWDPTYGFGYDHSYCLIFRADGPP